MKRLRRRFRTPQFLAGDSEDSSDKPSSTRTDMSMRTQETSTSALSLAGLLRKSWVRRRSTSVPFSSASNSGAIFQQKAPGSSLTYQIKKNDIEELGYIQFPYTDLTDALTEATKCAKPIFLLCAVIPGDVDAGKDIFSHPLIVEAAETLFVTCVSTSDELTVRSPNGKPCLTRIRLLEPGSGNELTPLVSGYNLTISGLVSAMITALESLSHTAPMYLHLLLQETQVQSRRVVFGTSDSARAEAELGGLEGVLSTRVGLLDRQRVTEVVYDAQRLSYSFLVRHTLRNNFGDIMYCQSNEERMVATIEATRTSTINPPLVLRIDAGTRIKYGFDPKHALRATPMRFLPLTDMQATRANSLIRSGKFNEAIPLLSPRQGLMLTKAMRVSTQKALHEVVDVPILLAWMSVCNGQHPIQREALPVEESSHSEDNGNVYSLHSTISHTF